MKIAWFALLLALLMATPTVSFAVTDDPALRASNRNIGDEELEPKDPFYATVFSILPGVVFHGSGNIYAGNFDFGSRMLVMEIFGGAFALWGHNIIHQPGNWGPYFGGDTTAAGYWVKAFGVGLMALSWVGDVATASEAAESWNKDHQIQFQIDSFNGEGARLMLASRF